MIRKGDKEVECEDGDEKRWENRGSEEEGRKRLKRRKLEEHNGRRRKKR